MSEQPAYVAVQFTRHADGKLRQAGDMFWQWQGDVRMLTLEPTADSASGTAPWLSRDDLKFLLGEAKRAKEGVRGAIPGSAIDNIIDTLQSRLHPEEIQQ